MESFQTFITTVIDVRTSKSLLASFIENAYLPHIMTGMHDKVCSLALIGIISGIILLVCFFFDIKRLKSAAETHLALTAEEQGPEALNKSQIYFKGFK